MAVDGDDFSAYASARWGSLVRTAVFLGSGIEEAQDVVQTALLRCFVSWDKVAEASDRDAYVYRILVNCLRDSHRRRWWGERPTALVPDRASEDTAEAFDMADAVHRALSELSTVNREVVVLRYFVHLTNDQTARALGIAPGTVKSRLSRSLAQLADNPHLATLNQGPER